MRLDGFFGSRFIVSTHTGSFPHVSAGTDVALIAYTHENDVVYRRVGFDRAFLDDSEQPLSTEPGRQRQPVPAWDGTQFFVEWVDDRADEEHEQPRGDLFAARLLPDGTVLDPSGFAVANDSTPETSAFVSALPDLTVLGGSIFREAFAMQRIGYRIAGMTPASVDPDPLSADFEALEVVPNPASAFSLVSFQLPSSGPVDVVVFDVAGAKVRQLHRGPHPAGRLQLSWDGRNSMGRAVAPGVYFVRATLGSESRVLKVLRR